jgi:hypothetical protein
MKNEVFLCTSSYNTVLVIVNPLTFLVNEQEDIPYTNNIYNIVNFNRSLLVGLLHIITYKIREESEGEPKKD